ncbi:MULTISPECIES: hypothetical protein [Methylobacterium]|jgi:hypothetical protein|uniref:hypothetical protein n=3 Tax=Methylobacteriaceae TaxID=119045 RepID=UPI0008F1ABD0|nr:hypothetical protein [Methylobacterium sp. yr596]MBZ6412519.1 hypothetical protein [Methylobacterium sp.]SFF05959.1 hypothetical protein SAMN04487844_109150 [Methylobacterium sp. yr596]
MRPAAVPFLAARLLVGAAFAAPAAAQDAAPERPVAEPAAVTEAGAPLLLRIRPRDEAPVDGSGEETAEAAREAERQAAVARAAAAREAFEARITARANRAIASVCTGCLGPVPPSVALAPPDAVAAPPRLVPASVAMTDP